MFVSPLLVDAPPGCPSRHRELTYTAMQLGWLNCLEDAFSDIMRVYRRRVGHPRVVKRPRHPLSEEQVDSGIPFLLSHSASSFHFRCERPVERADTRFLCALLIVECDEVDISHANAILFDYERRIMYRFEPNGAFKLRSEEELAERTPQDACFSRMYHYADRVLEDFAYQCSLHYVSCLDLCGGKYTNIMGHVWDALPEENTEEGMCGAMSLFFIHCVLLNPDADVGDIVEHFFLQREPLELYDCLCRYSHGAVSVAQ